MDTPSSKPSLHPIMVIAAVAVVLFCGVGSAAIMGWLPTSSATVPGAAAMPGQLSSVPAAEPQQPPQHSQQSQQAGYANNAAPSQGSYPAQQQQEQVAQQGPAVCNSCGVVESVRSIEHRGQGSGVGAAGGAILGGLLGNQVGSGHGRQLATVAGAVGGAVAGNQVEGNMKTTHSWEIVVRMDNGKKRVLHQSAQPQWRSGDQVKVVNGQLHSA
ncbi:glycine zipper 2TM domain-containing protein [Duganella violaceipulchra]|uniref:Glycine zipper 2TM domain-containing protein n=1 Tax=Duganella violaceipulchra TaxID=2849652 RepID=A0AA41HIT0_9BURK|nr:glycine zipper 2TM domain-containing protein [Duganella violaceicalia]MBV6324608.1 glycine zipper 2TM domain-containing protein [Duganella violaceicalia]MCP2009947.1 outer membrane lipoprotein SlyB [Duganella violaceicalia]